MGYILPVTHYDYKQYQNRMKEASESPYYIDSVYKTVFHRISTEYEERENNEYNPLPLERLEEKEKNPNIKKQHNPFYVTRRQQVTLTGKGRNFNEQI